MNVNDLRRQVLLLAGYLAEEDALTAAQGQSSIRETVSRICADRNTSPVAMALIAAELADFVDRANG